MHVNNPPRFEIESSGEHTTSAESRFANAREMKFMQAFEKICISKVAFQKTFLYITY
jgi:hypothetical protein